MRREGRHANPFVAAPSHRNSRLRRAPMATKPERHAQPPSPPGHAPHHASIRRRLVRRLARQCPCRQQRRTARTGPRSGKRHVRGKSARRNRPKPIPNVALRAARARARSRRRAITARTTRRGLSPSGSAARRLCLRCRSRRVRKHHRLHQPPGRTCQGVRCTSRHDSPNGSPR